MHLDNLKINHDLLKQQFAHNFYTSRSPFQNHGTEPPPSMGNNTPPILTIFKDEASHPFKPHFKVFYTPGEGTIASFLHVYKVATHGASPEFKAKHILGCMSRAAQETLAASLTPGLSWEETVQILT